MTILDAGRLVAIVRARRAGDLDGTVDAIVRGGIPIVEITLDTPGALAAIGRARARGVAVGAGTALDGDAVRASAEAGASFVVSPGLSPDVVAAAHACGIEVIPGVLSPTELLRALEMGVEAVKVFPAGPAGGPELVRALRGPFPDAALVPTGGIPVTDVAAYLDAGATAVGLGGGLVGSEPPGSDAELEKLERRAAEAAAIADAWSPR